MANIASNLGSVWRVVTAPFRWFARLLGSFRFWLLTIASIVILLIAYYAFSDRYTPLTADAYVQAYVVQVAPQVAGQVVAVHVREGQSVRAGDPLFEVDPRPFEHRVARLEAKLVEVEQDIKRLAAQLAAAEAESARVSAEAAYAQAVYEQEDLIFQRASTTERKYLDALQTHRASQAAVERATHAAAEVRHLYEARINGEHALVAQVRAELADARLDLEFCRVISPCDALISDLQLRVGAFAHIGQAMLTCIDTSQWLVIARLPENSLVGLRESQPALVAMQSMPGRLYEASVFAVGWGVEEGQGVPSGLLPAVRNPPSWVPPAQRFQVRLVVTDEDRPPLRVGASCSVSIYTRPRGWLNELTRGIHQVIAWFYYL